MPLSPALAAVLADIVLTLHVGIAVFVIGMTLLVPVGGVRGWRWVRASRLRWLHVGLVVVIAVQAWLGRLCPLTIWEQRLRMRAGQPAYEGSFVSYWLSKVLFFEAPWWSFVAAYSLLVLVVAAAWIRWPPERRRAQAG